MSRVVVTLRARRYSVVKRSIDGNVENASARGRYSESISITVEIIRLMEIKRSTIAVGSGMIKSPMMQTTRTASTRSPNLENTFEKFVKFFSILFV